MRNPLSFRIESLLGSLFLAGIAIFFLAFFFIAVKNFNSDIEIDTAQTTNQFRRIRDFSELRKQLINQ